MELMASSNLKKFEFPSRSRKQNGFSVKKDFTILFAPNDSQKPL